MGRLWLWLLLVAAVLLSTAPAEAADPRYCGPPERYESGRIKRSAAVLLEFKRLYPCDSTGLKAGPCPGWQIDHVIPLVCGGCDTVDNLQWLPLSIKTCAGEVCKDRWERRIYCLK